MKLLCLSNGHGEDAIAVRILRELQQQAHPPEIAALPIVGEGKAYQQFQIPIAGPVKVMPSGGFLYMDQQQLWRDIGGGLLGLTWQQRQVVRAWGKQGAVILAVGDVVPLLFGWLSGAPFAFVGTAKSEYYVQDEAGSLFQKSRLRRWIDDRWFRSVYLPWERWLMNHPRCKAVFPRDQLTSKVLQQWNIPAFDLGNPMMDGLEPTLTHQKAVCMYNPDLEKEEMQRSLSLLLLPGSRPPEAYANWTLILQALAGILADGSARPTIALAAIAPGLNLDTFQEILVAQGWQSQKTIPNNQLVPDLDALYFTQKNATLVLSTRSFNDCLHQADLAIAMAGTATEQFVGLGKPVVSIAGQGPQFTYKFAEAQTRLLGSSVTLVRQPQQVAKVVQSLLQDPDRLQLIAENGQRRMGKAGAAKRIAECLNTYLLQSSS